MNVHNETHSILGIIDHGTRFAISLEAVRSASAIAILRVLFDVIERFGKPHILRTDNGSQFHSMLFRFALVLLGIRQQFSKPGMPWMNGRIERLFGTLKERLNHFSLADFSGLQLALAEFRVQYNLLRPHQHLDGRTPHEAWRKINPYQRPPKQIRYLVAWGGLLTGFYLQY
jgi:transposase InsO family protein